MRIKNRFVRKTLTSKLCNCCDASLEPNQTRALSLLASEITRFEIRQGAEGLQALLADTEFRPCRTALLSDIHGDYAGLEAALLDIEGQNCERIMCLGDLVEGGPENERVVERLLELRIPCVRGNHDEVNVRRASEKRRTIHSHITSLTRFHRMTAIP